MAGGVVMRSLRERERAVLIVMIDNDHDLSDPVPVITVEQRQNWRDQAGSVQVGGVYGCGKCPTIDLVDKNATEPAGRRIVLSGFRGDEGILLFIDGDRLSCLELYSHTDDVIDMFPRPNEITHE